MPRYSTTPTRWRVAPVFAMVIVLAGCGSASGGGASAPVPPNIQRAVHHEYGRHGFLPTRVPSGYGFQQWTADCRGGFNMSFNRGTTQQLQFGVDVGACERPKKAMHTFEANGLSVAWSATEEDQQAWRCVTVNGTPVMIQSGASVTGDVSLTTSTERQDAQKLVDLVAYAHLAQ